MREFEISFGNGCFAMELKGYESDGKLNNKKIFNKYVFAMIHTNEDGICLIYEQCPSDE